MFPIIWVRNVGLARHYSHTLSLPRVINFKFPLQHTAEVVYHTVWRTWLFIAYSDERWLYYLFPTATWYKYQIRGDHFIVGAPQACLWALRSGFKRVWVGATFRTPSVIYECRSLKPAWKQLNAENPPTYAALSRGAHEPEDFPSVVRKRVQQIPRGNVPHLDGEVHAPRHQLVLLVARVLVVRVKETRDSSHVTHKQTVTWTTCGKRPSCWQRHGFQFTHLNVPLCFLYTCEYRYKEKWWIPGKEDIWRASAQTFLIHGRQPEVTISELYIVSRNNTNGKQPLLTSMKQVNACDLIAMPK